MSDFQKPDSYPASGKPSIEQPLILNNRYQLETRQGSGGMAMVYRAHDLMLERTVAIKILRKSYANDPAFRERFRLEAKAAANLSHPNIATVHDFGLDSNQLFIVMEYIPGTDLKSMLKQKGRLPAGEAMALMSQACAGIGYAHRAGLVHCDIKPQNILITPDGRVKVVDFGIARALSSIREEERVEVVWGSPQYFSPEQAAGSAPSPSSDVYSLGIVLYEMLTGRVPFMAETPEELAQLHQESLPPSPRRLNPDIPPAVEKILLKVLAKEPTARYQTADQFGRVLTALEAQLGEAAVPVASPTASQPARAVAPVVAARPVITPPQPVRVFQTHVSQQPGQASGPAEFQAEPADFDWLTWLLLLLAVLAAGGLIPFWIWVIYRLNPPV